MTAEERRRPDIIGGSRRRRIARGSGTTPQDVNQLLNQFSQMQKMMRQMMGVPTGKGQGWQAAEQEDAAHDAAAREHLQPAECVGFGRRGYPRTIHHLIAPLSLLIRINIC